MKLNHYIYIFLFILLYIPSFFNPKVQVNAQTHIENPAMGDSAMKITILYDNYTYAENTQSDWGFSCLIEGLEKKILFDTGTKPDILMHNIQVLGVDISAIDLIIISHNHRDHTGGMSAVLKHNNHAIIYLPLSTPAADIASLENQHFEMRKEKEPKEIIPDVYLSGELGKEIPEQSLIIKSKEGLIVITGCSHPGIENILHRVREISKDNIYLVFGGFHLMRHSEKEVKVLISEFKSLGVQKCGCTHCTGDNAIALFKEAYQESFIPMGTGKVIEIKKF